MIKSKTFSLILALFLAVGMSAQGYTVIVNGTLANTQGTIVPVTIQTIQGTVPSTSLTTQTNSGGFYTDSLFITSNPGWIMVSFTDCNGNLASQSLQVQPNSPLFPTVVFANDTFCSAPVVDCLGVVNGPAVIGTACTDTLGNTGIWDANCFCMTNTPPADCLGVPGGTAFPGTACTDTMGVAGIWDPNCICVTNTQGPDCLGIPGGTAVPGTSCIDSTGNAGLWDANCNCIANGTGSTYALVWLQMMNTQGQVVPVTIASCDSLTQPTFSYTTSTDASGILIDTILFTSSTACISISFTDCNGNTITQPITQATAGSPSFMFTADWCPVTTADCLGNPGGSALPGTACVDSLGVAGTWDANCNCQPSQGTIDCLGIAGGTALPGTSCTDSLGNAGIWNPNCVCISNTLADCLGNLGGTALPGTSCNDGNPNTFNDTWDLACNCIGFLPMADCMGVIGGPDVPGAPCNDNDSTTVFDHWDWNCNCAGIPLNPGACNAQFAVFQNIDSTGTVVPNTLNVVTLFALPAIGNGLTFSWDFGDGNTSNAAFPTHTYNGNGPYNLCVTISDSSCTDTYCDSVSVDTSGVIIRGQSGFTINVTPAQATSVQEVIETPIDFTLYPNPAMDEVMLSFSDNVSGMTNVSILDVSGKLIRTDRFNARSGMQEALDIRQLDAGIYFLSVESENKKTTKRLVKATR